MWDKDIDGDKNMDWKEDVFGRLGLWKLLTGFEHSGHCSSFPVGHDDWADGGCLVVEDHQSTHT